MRDYLTSNYNFFFEKIKTFIYWYKYNYYQQYRGDYMCSSKKKFFIHKVDPDWEQEDRVFKNNKVVFNNDLGHIYSVDEIVEVLNNDSFYSDLFTFIQFKIWYMESQLFEKEDNEILKAEIDFLRDLREEMVEPISNTKKYSKLLREKEDVILKKRLFGHYEPEV